MEQSVINWLEYGKKTIRGKDIRFSCVYYGVLSFFYNLFRFSRITLTIADVAVIALILVLGLKANKKKGCMDVHLYTGVTNIFIAIRYYMFSWLLAVYSGLDAGFAFFVYSVLFVAVSIWYGFLVKKLISRNTYSSEYKRPPSWPSLCGAVFATILSPIVFSNLEQNAAQIIVAVGMLLLGVGTQCAIIALFKFAVLFRMPKS